MSKREAEGGSRFSDFPNGEDKPKKRKSRFSAPEAKVIIPGMPASIPPGLDETQTRLYLIQLQIEEITRRLKTGELGIPTNPEERSPSPEPIYNQSGVRLNTREYRKRKSMEDNRHALVQEALTLNPSYVPPGEYKAPSIKCSDKVDIPQDLFQEINFVGMLIGPRGNSLKQMEAETGCKIIIRGKGSVKEGKVRPNNQSMPGEEENLHAYITASTMEIVKKGVDKINFIIKQAIEVPEAENKMRQEQLKQLALLNGTLRDNDGLQKLRDLAEADEIITNRIICQKCGNAGHIAKDCQAERLTDSLVGGGAYGGPQPDRMKLDTEYMSLMEELGQEVPDHMKALKAKQDAIDEQRRNGTLPPEDSPFTPGSATQWRAQAQAHHHNTSAPGGYGVSTRGGGGFGYNRPRMPCPPQPPMPRGGGGGGFYNHGPSYRGGPIHPPSSRYHELHHSPSNARPHLPPPPPLPQRPRYEGYGPGGNYGVPPPPPPGGGGPPRFPNHPREPPGWNQPPSNYPPPPPPS